jgi:Arc/MetJ-type ribon-helix-helix transcriptional regulator
VHPIQVRLTRELIEKVDELIDKGMYPNRSEAIRDAVRRLQLK